MVRPGRGQDGPALLPRAVISRQPGGSRVEMSLGFPGWLSPVPSGYPAAGGGAPVSGVLSW
jgi:hypothetical protein